MLRANIVVGGGKKGYPDMSTRFYNYKGLDAARSSLLILYFQTHTDDDVATEHKNPHGPAGKYHNREKKERRRLSAAIHKDTG